MRLLARRYRTIAELGRGGMGVVWRAHDERLGRDVAVKVLHDWVADDAALRRRFEREAAALAVLQHPHVVRLYDVADDDGRMLLVMELVEGSTLADTVRGARSRGSRPPAVRARRRGARIRARARGRAS